MWRALYSLLMIAALPLIVLRLLWRSHKEPRYRRHIGERFGRFRSPALEGAIWIHAVSVGEMRAAQPLVEALRRRYPRTPLLLTCMTPTGREAATSLYGQFATIAYLPYDLVFLMRRFLSRFRPALLLIMETELWPNLLAACRAGRIPAYLVNGRLSQRSLARYERLAPVRSMIRDALGQLSGLAAQHERDALRFSRLGGKEPLVTGNLKFDVLIDERLRETGLGWRRQLAPPRQVFLAVSTRDGEERAIAEAYARAFDPEARRRQLLLLVPRHPPRFDAVADLVRESGLRMSRRSETQVIDPGVEVWLGDSMGEVAAYVAMCDFAFIGGSLLPLGGQNLIEVCAQGKPVLMGPSTFNFAEAARAAKAAGALVSVADADALMREARHWFDDPVALAAHAGAAHRFARENQGATQRTLALIQPSLEQPATNEPAGD